ncbi:MAG TPA: hypothetical protein VFG09_09000 [Thermodesulfovibrionales bacterium]|jgi:hypothetical protein|nr:hypothetical protein [Thermodesulfovibrionales bacterium]
MDAYRYQELIYLVVPVMLGIEFFRCAKEEKREKEGMALGSYALDFFGFIFMALVPAVFAFTIWGVESKTFSSQNIALARLDRYGILFLFMGAWWQIYLFGALRARTMRKRESGKWFLWIPFLILGVFISLLVLWVSPFNLKWISAIWFLGIFGLLNIIKAKPRTIERTMWFLAITTFIVENILWIWLDSIV